MEFNVNPYYDDFEEINGPRESNYMRILFKPGYAVQARELTQLQTIIQNQIKEFGGHIFKDGSPVHGGHLSVDNNVTALILEKQYNSLDINPSNFKDQLIIENASNNSKKSAKVIAIDDTQSKPTLMVKYLTNDFDDGDAIQSSVDGSIVAQLVAVNSQTIGSVASINEGVFYVNGFFVYVPAQSIVLEAYSTSPTYRIGLQIEDTFVDVSQDSTLADPAQGSFNYQAPGADRYQFNLSLAKRPLDSTDDSRFFELLRVENGVITKQVTYPLYSDIEKTLARRTYDESGDYTVKTFKVGTSENTEDSTKFNLDISAGKAYVKGYEFETIGTTKFALDKARTTNSSRDYDLPLNYGNYVVVSNLHLGSNTDVSLDTSQLTELDLHTVPTANIDTSSAESYSNTKIGTARIRNITYAGTNAYYVYLTAINTSPLIANNNGTASNANIINLPFLTNLDNAYANVDISIIAGTSVGDSRRIIFSNAMTGDAIVDRDFSFALDSTSRISFNFGTKDIDSIVVPPGADSFGGNLYYPQDLISAVYPCMDIDKSGQTYAGNTYFGQTNLNKYIFPLPESYITHDDFDDIVYYSRKFLFDIGLDGGSGTKITIGGGSGLDSGTEFFYYGSDGQALTRSQFDENLLVLVRNPGTSPFITGQILTYSDFSSVTRTSENEVYFQFASSYSGMKVDVFVNVKVVVGNTTYRIRQKTLHGNTANNKLISTDDFMNSDLTPTSGGLTGTGVYIDTANAHVWFTSSAEMANTPGTKQSLYVPDVFKIIKIYDSGDIAYAPNVTNAIDITENYLFDSGQNDNYYDHSWITLRDTASPPTGQTVVMMQYFEHSGSVGFFNASSYDKTNVYDKNIIPVYSSTTSGTFSLRDCIDLRPTRRIARQSFILDGTTVANPDLPMTLSYGFYLPRIDKLIATQNKEFKVLPGIPAYVPVEPSDSEDGMTLYSIYIPPYTFDIRDIKFKYYDHKRYTMADIGRIDKRLSQVEYYTSLSLLESKARSQTVLYEDAVLQKEKYGIVVDQFDGFNIADNRNSDLLCQISFNSLKPYKVTNIVPFKLLSSNMPYKKNGKTYSLSFTESPAVVQNTATKAVSIQPYLFAQYSGKMTLSPETDSWFSVKLPPEVISPPTDTITPARPPIEEPVIPVVGSTQTIVANTNLDNVGYGYIPWQQQTVTSNTSAVVEETVTDQPTVAFSGQAVDFISGYSSTNYPSSFLFPMWKNIWFY